MATCCMCRGGFSSGLAKKKRKKLHGLACKESRILIVSKAYGSMAVMHR